MNLIRLFAAAVTLALAGCGGGDGDEPPDTPTYSLHAADAAVLGAHHFRLAQAEAVKLSCSALFVLTAPANAAVTFEGSVALNVDGADQAVALPVQVDSIGTTVERPVHVSMIVALPAGTHSFGFKFRLGAQAGAHAADVVRHVSCERGRA